MTPAPSVVFHCRASRRVGAGHVMRCLALADALRRRGWRVSFAVPKGTPTLVPALAGSGFDVVIAKAPGELAAVWPHGVDLVVLDDYALDCTFESQLRPWAAFVCVLDDLANRLHACDVLVDSAASEHAYDGLVDPSCELLLGPEFALLRREFFAQRLLAQRQSLSNAKDLRVLVSLGGTDPDGWVLEVCRWLARAELPFDATFVLGAACAHRDHLENLTHALDGHPEVVGYAPDLAKKTALVDVVIGSGGVSAWERCALGIPSLLVVIAENQRNVGEVVVRAGAARLLKALVSERLDLPAEVLRDFIPASPTAQTMRTAALSLCDGLGAERVASVLAARVAGEAGSLRLRKISSAHVQCLYEWQQDPRTRQFARNPSVPTRAEHDAWFQRKLSDVRCIMHVIERDAQPVGTVRLDLLDSPARDCEREPTNWEISIVTAPDARRSGVGRQGLQLLRALMPGERLHAHVLEDNAASQALFEAAGFVRSASDAFTCEPTRLDPEQF